MDRNEDAFGRVVARIEQARDDARRNPEAHARAIEAQRQMDRSAWLHTLRARCDARGVPRAEDIRRWVYSECLDGRASAALTGALARRGDPRDARWAIVALLGPAGVGKSAAMARAVARHPRAALFAFARDAARALADRPRPFEHERAAMELAASLRDVDLLALDELGTEAPCDVAELLHLISSRCDAGLVTLIAGNLPMHLFTARYLDADTRFASRLASPRGSLVDFDGHDLRASGGVR